MALPVHVVPRQAAHASSAASSRMLTFTRCSTRRLSPCSRYNNISPSYPSTSSCRHFQSSTAARGPTRRSIPARFTQKPSPRLSPGARSYHSESQPSPSATSETYTPEQRAILSAALSHVPEHGFNTHTLTLGARDAGYLDVSLQLFPRGGESELVMFWLASRREELKRKVEDEEVFGTQEAQSSDKGTQSTLSAEEKVKILIVERLKMNEGIIAHWQNALAIMSLPSNVPPSLNELYTLSSDILYLAGDNSVDASWYAKRLSVSTVYASAEVFMTEDKSEGFASTVEFVERRIKDTNNAVDAVGDVKKYMGYVAGSVVAAGRSFGMKI